MSEPPPPFMFQSGPQRRPENSRCILVDATTVISALRIICALTPRAPVNHTTLANSGNRTKWHLSGWLGDHVSGWYGLRQEGVHVSYEVRRRKPVEDMSSQFKLKSRVIWSAGSARNICRCSDGQSCGQSG